MPESDRAIPPSFVDFSVRCDAHVTDTVTIARRPESSWRETAMEARPRSVHARFGAQVEAARITSRVFAKAASAPVWLHGRRRCAWLRLGVMQLRSEIEVDAVPERIWRVILDFARYPDWNPFIQRIDGQPAVGARLEMLLTPPDGRERRLRATVVQVDTASELVWKHKLWFQGLFDGEHSIQLTELEVGTTRVVNKGEFRGRLVQYMGRSLTQTARGLVGMNQALKRRVESGR
jgi:hypothetical protein